MVHYTTAEIDECLLCSWDLPPNFESVRESRIAPSRVYDDLDHIESADHTKIGYSAHTKDSYDAEEKDSTSAIRQLEAVLDQETLKLYNKRYEEEYNINDDQVYNVWCKLKASSESSVSPIVNKKVLSVTPKTNLLIHIHTTHSHGHVHTHEHTQVHTTHSHGHVHTHEHTHLMHTYMQSYAQFKISYIYILCMSLITY